MACFERTQNTGIAELFTKMRKPINQARNVARKLEGRQHPTPPPDFMSSEKQFVNSGL